MLHQYIYREDRESSSVLLAEEKKKENMYLSLLLMIRSLTITD